MVRSVIFSVLWVVAALGAAAAPPATITICGRLLHAPREKLLVATADYYSSQRPTTVALDAEGRFTITLPWHQEGPARLVYTPGSDTGALYLWLKPGDTLTVNGDARQFVETVKFTGPAAPLNTYLVQERRAFEPAEQQQATLMNRPVERAAAWLDSVHNRRRAFLKQAFPQLPAPSDQAFRDWRTADIDYSWAVARLDYANQYAKQRPDALQPTDPYFDFLRDPALRLNNPAATGLKSYALFSMRYLDYHAARKLGSLSAPITRLTLYQVVGEQIPPGTKQEGMLYGLVQEAIARDEPTVDSLYTLAMADPRLAEWRQGLRKAWELFQQTPNTNGRPASDFTFLTEEGQQMKLSDLRGKLVYLSFWESWHTNGMAAAHELHAALRNQPKLVFLNVSLDYDVANWRKAIKKFGVDGLNGWAGDQVQSPALRAFGVPYVSRFFLIGPDGRVLNSNTPQPGNGAREAIESALKRM